MDFSWLPLWVEPIFTQHHLKVLEEEEEETFSNIFFALCVPLVALFWSFSEEDSDENRGKLAAALIQSDMVLYPTQPHKILNPI